MELEEFELVILRRPAEPASYDEETLDRIQQEHLAYLEIEVMHWWCPPGLMVSPGRVFTVDD